ncbi:L,D-transpeptidase family protein [Pedobacter metabolipauper]|uniref:L,D-transpeptidase family protein n=1 Tax=Pedobacter metabolipauper TaxID=425513 RepID=UPI001FB68E64|nr:L,D-transpeptidase family protein [Pedobacter metabolipauper]
MKKTILIFIPLILMLSACGWFRDTPEVGVVLAKHFNNKLYKKFDTAVYNTVFIKYLDSLSPKFSNPKTLRSFYEEKQLNPELVMKFFVNGELDTLAQYIERSSAHGFNPETFGHKDLADLLGQLKADKFKSIDAVYPVIAGLELHAAQSLIKYQNFIYYGSLNPRKLFNRYYIVVKRPDSASINAVLQTSRLADLLKEIQPRSSAYLSLQNELFKYSQASSRDEQAIKTILVNMERRRWKTPELGDEYVEVNIPDFSLTWFKKQDTLSHMKVCVGGKREDGYSDKIKQFLKSGKLEDKPKNHETPMLYSKLNSIQVNPIWNIPVSIARSEIYYQALKDPYYLSNSNIKVYYKGKVVDDPDTIQWNKYSRERLPFQFKQGSGGGNALGKFKFIFDNGSSIYLHDTNNKTAFNYTNRAISHGCVRVERPLEFAETLVKDKYEYDQLRMEVNLPPIDTNKMALYKKKLAKKADTVNIFQLKPKWFGVKKPVPLIINYITAWSQNGTMQFRPDVYSLDETLWNAMRKFM